jgi:hypothetical protein
MIVNNVGCGDIQNIIMLGVHAAKGLAFNDCHEDHSTAAQLFGRI